MTLDEGIAKMQKLREKASGDTELFFDTEGGTYNVHLVGIQNIHFQPKIVTLLNGEKVEADYKDRITFHDDHKNCLH